MNAFKGLFLFLVKLKSELKSLIADLLSKQSHLSLNAINYSDLKDDVILHCSLSKNVNVYFYEEQVLVDELKKALSQQLSCDWYG